MGYQKLSFQKIS
jgi:hypothetical protein